MKATISRDHLLKAIQTVHPAVSTRSTLPILSHLLIEAKKGQIQVTATDLELGISTQVQAEVAEEGSVAVPGKRIYDLLRDLPSEMIYLSAKKNQQMTIECGKRLFKVMGLPKEEFPKLPTIGGSDTLTIDQGVLQAMLSLTYFSVSKDESRYVLTGTLFVTKNGWLRLVSTDGRRMSMVEREAKMSSLGDHQQIVPEKALSELGRLLVANVPVKLFIKENQIAFDLGSTVLLSRLIEGKFPNYEQVIPPQSSNKLTVQREELLMAARRISLWSTQESPSIRLDLKINQLILSKQTPEVGEAHEELPVRYAGPEFSVGFNPAYLIDVLKELQEGSVEFEIPGPDRPGVIRTQDHYLYVVLPMQLNS
jgi:DNA polymerase III subunit beta